jgi:hypothetical protein
MNPSKNRGAAAQLLPVQVPANGRFAVKATGSFLSIVESPVRVGIKLDSGGWAKCAAGTSLSCKDGAYFEGFEIENPSANAITVLVYTGFAEFIDRRVAVIEPATAVRGATLPQSRRGWKPAGSSFYSQTEALNFGFRFWIPRGMSFWSYSRKHPSI